MVNIGKTDKKFRKEITDITFKVFRDIEKRKKAVMKDKMKY